MWCSWEVLTQSLTTPAGAGPPEGLTGWALACRWQESAIPRHMGLSIGLFECPQDGAAASCSEQSKAEATMCLKI